MQIYSSSAKIRNKWINSHYVKIYLVQNSPNATLSMSQKLHYSTTRCIMKWKSAILPRLSGTGLLKPEFKSLLTNSKLDSELSPVISPSHTQIHTGNSKLIDHVTSLIFCKNSSKRWSIALLLWYNLAQEEFKQVPSKRCAHCTPLYFSTKILNQHGESFWRSIC